jgi:glycosyltransferase involved in cell wall biosynthesis
MEPLPLTLLVMTRNEEAKIGRCLDSVPFAAEKVVIDSESTDATVAVAHAHGARVVVQPWLGFGAQRNFSTQQSSHDWILFLDADETLTELAQREFLERFPKILSSDAAGALLPRTADYMGRPMRWYRPMLGEMLGRLYHRDRARWSERRVHESVIFEGPVWRFRHPFHHHHSPTLVHKQLKVLRYSEMIALERYDRGRKPFLWAVPFVYIGTFLKECLVYRALFDGWRGVVVAHINASYAVYKRVRLYEMSVHPESRRAAEEVLERHDLWL